MSDSGPEAEPQPSGSALIERSPAGVVRVALDGRLLDANPAAARLLGFDSPVELLAHNANEFCQGPAASALLARLLRQRSLAGVELELLRPGGAPVWVSAALSLASGPGGPVVEAILFDISARRQAEQRLVRLNRLYAALSRANRACARFFERLPLLEEVCRIAVEEGGLQRAWFSLAGESPDRPLVTNNVAVFPLAVQSRRLGAFHIEAAAPDSFDERVIELLGELAADVAFALESIERDASRRHLATRQAEEALKESNRQLTSVLESITDAFLALDRDWRFTYVNRRAEQLVGRTRRELQGKDLWQEFPALAGSAFEEPFRQAAAEGRPAEFTACYDPLKLWLDVHVYPWETGVSIYLQDITTRKELEEQLGQSQRLEALGRLAGGVAHDFNNLLTIIGGYGQMILQRLDSGHEMRKDIEPIVEAANRASALTRQLLAFSRRQNIQPKVIDLNRLVAKMNKMLRRVIGEDIELRLVLKPDAGRIKADPGQLEQVLMNLAVNARDAMPTGGLLTIATEAFNSSGSGGPPGLAAGTHLLLTVSDSGTGIDEHTRRHLFEPFFTTKGKGKGTGLGLSTVYGIVKQSGGEISVESEPGKGATFRIYLPRANKTPKRKPVRETSRHARRGTETILLVEDEAEVRRLACGMLTRLGYKVLEAGDGPEALALCPDCGKPDLLLTDVIMPQMSGRELAERLRELQPDLKVLFVSGYTHDVIARHGVVESEASVLHKPFTHDALGLAVRSVLDAGRVPSPAGDPAVGQ